MLEKMFGQDITSPLIRDAVSEIFKMLEKEEAMFKEGVGVLLENRQSSFNIAEADEDINYGERMIRRMVIEHLTLTPKKDLPASLILVSIVQDVERLGDFAKGLLEISSYADFRREGPMVDTLKGLAGRIYPQFVKVRQAFREDNVALAREVMQTHRVIKKECQHLLRDMAAGTLDDVRQTAVYTMTAIVFRRVSAHLSNVASTVVQPFDKIRHDEAL